MGTKIAWCDETINPIVGCSKTSEGCSNCYAENMAARLASMGMGQYQSVTSFRRWNGLTAFVPSELEKPYRWKKPRSIFISSMGDVFHDSATKEWHDQIMNMIHHCPQHTFIMLTKRPERMQSYFIAYSAFYGSPAKNLALGVSAESQDAFNYRVPLLINTPALKRFVSIEPMVEPVELTAADLLNPIGVILGGESGRRARQLDHQWVRTVRDQCAAVNAPFMFKQWSYANRGDIDIQSGLPILDGRTHSELVWVQARSQSRD